ncbi:MAG: hypothetical protein LBI28_09075 [Treponema sp.]|jgi:hypothetical protein|nr:hypothetical protein [Treponema sp.]
MRDNRRITILFLLGIFISGILFAQESLTYVVERATTAHNWGRGENIVLNVGDRITTNGKVGQFLTDRDSDEYHIMILYQESDREYRTLARDFRPINTEDTFGNDIFIDYPMDSEASINNNLIGPAIAIGDVNEMWVPAYYCDVLIGKNRNKLVEIHRGLNYLTDSPNGDTTYWYETTQADIQNGRAMFYNAVIKLGVGTHFAVKNIIKTEYGYRVDCIESTWDDRYSYSSFLDSQFWSRYKPGDAMTLFLYLDGDYLDIYVDGRDMLLGRFVKVGREFIRQYQSLIRTNTCDLSRVQLPRRADGSTDYSLPAPSTIEEAPPLNTDNTAAGLSQADDFIQRDKNSQSLPLWALIAIIGGAVVVAGGVAVFIVKRRK